MADAEARINAARHFSYPGMETRPGCQSTNNEPYQDITSRWVKGPISIGSDVFVIGSSRSPAISLTRPVCALHGPVPTAE